MGFSQCLADESLLMGTIEKGTVVVCVYNGDRLCAGNKYAIKEFKDEIKQHFPIKEEGEMNEDGGCKVKKMGESSLVIYQDDLINKMERIIGKEVKNVQ